LGFEFIEFQEERAALWTPDGKVFVAGRQELPGAARPSLVHPVAEGGA
jgi:hypothetical protein